MTVRVFRQQGETDGVDARGRIDGKPRRQKHRYPRAVLRRIAFIVFAQRIGLSLDEIAEELGKLPAEHTPSPDDWAQLSGEWLKRIDERVEELQRLREGLTKCIGCGCLSFDACWIANPDDRTGRAGPGPRFWV